MRVRTGKVIKAISLLGRQNTSTVLSPTASWQAFGYNNDGSFSLGGGATNKYLTVDSTHKYFIYNCFEPANITTSAFILYTYSPDASSNKEKTYGTAQVYGSNYACGVISGIEHDGRANVSFRVSSNINISLTVLYSVIIDLTSTFGSGKEPTAQQFYNKYNKYFPLIATGEEITIDDKAGQIKTIKSSLDDYIELEYIESTGAQYISTGISADINIGTDITFANADNYMGGIIGEDNTYAWNRYGLFRNGNLYPMVCSGTSYSVFSSTIPWYHIDFKYPKLIVNDATYDLPTGSCGSGTIEIFRMTSSYYSKIRVKSCRFYTTERTLGNFIPAIRKSDNEIGMLDKVNNVFHTNQGTGTFIAGPTKSLPSEYQEVEYIESTGTQWIDSGLTSKGKGNTTVELKVSPSQSGVDRAFFGEYSNSVIELGQLSTKWRTNVNGTATDLTVNEVRVWSVKSDGGWYVDGVRSGTDTIGTQESSITMRLFGRFYNSSMDKNASCSIYYCKIWESNILKRDFIPCYRKSDNVIGMYDLVNRVFYTNQGTGTFLKGNNVNNTISCKVAGGSSDIYYGYNNLAMPFASDYYYSEYNTGPTNARTYDLENNSTTYTADGSNMNFRLLSTSNFQLSVVQGHYYYVKAKFTWNCANAIITKMGNLSVLTSPGINVVDSGKSITNGEYFENIHQVTATGTARWVWSPQIASGSVQTGDTFTTSDLEIIDLTDWFGVGKEPSTVQEFKEKFTKDYYGFCPTPIKLTRYQIEALPSYGYNQNANNVTTRISNGITLTNNGNGSYSVSGTASADVNIYFGSQNLDGSSQRNHVFLIQGAPSSSSYSTYYLRNDNRPNENQVDLGSGKLFTWTAAFSWAFQLIVKSGTVITTPVIFWPQVIDLTDWYGAGNEPTTIEEFKATFPNKYYPYSKKRLLNKYMINKLVD